MTAEARFFEGTKLPIVLASIMPKLNREDEKRLRLDFVMPLTAKTLDLAPEDVKDAFYAIVKDGRHINPAGITTEFTEVQCSFYATVDTKSPQIEIGSCTLRQLEVSRPKNKATLDDGDVSLTFHLNAPANMDLWKWAYHGYGKEMAVLFESLEPVQLKIPAKAAEDTGQDALPLNGEQTEGEAAPVGPLVTLEEQRSAFPELPPEQRQATKKIKTTSKKKKATAKK